MARFLRLIWPTALVLICGSVTLWARHASPPSQRKLPLGAIVYISGGDLYRKDLPDGMPLRLTHDGSNNTPSYLPSGKWIAYVHRRDADDLNGNIRFVSSDGRTTKSWAGRDDDSDSPARIPVKGLYRANMNDELACCEKDGVHALSLNKGTDKLLIPKSGDEYLLYACWSPDGKYLAYTTCRKDFTSTLWCATSSGDSKRRLYSQSDSEFIISGFSPNDQYIVFGNMVLSQSVAEQLAVYDLRNQKARYFSDVKTRRIIDGGFEDTDFRKIDNRFVVDAQVTNSVVPYRWISTIDPRINLQPRITNDSITALSPTWSPDGQQIACYTAPIYELSQMSKAAAPDSSLHNYRLTILSPSGITMRHFDTVLDDHADRPFWLNDGHHVIVEISEKPNGRTTALCMMDVKSGAVRPVVSNLSMSGRNGNFTNNFTVWSPRI